MSKKDNRLCLRCYHFKTVEIPVTWSSGFRNVGRRIPSETAYYCNKLDRYIQKIRQTCKHFLDHYDTRLHIGGDGLVKIKEIPTEAERIDLKELPREAVLMAVSEKIQPSAEGRTGGLVITYKLKDGRTFPQKYSPVSGAVLGRALRKLKIKDTEELQKNWYKYELTAMRIGLPRMIPREKVKA
ncbi:MAG: hypothetical protein HWN68_12860 [Desulfobacterales bacterium]|nr:hypothetical protein [Desulfobacterales bacterium]